MAPSKNAPAKHQSRPQQPKASAPAKSAPAPAKAVAKSVAPAKSTAQAVSAKSTAPAKSVAKATAQTKAPAKVTPPPPVEEEVDLETEVTAVAPEPVVATTAPAKRARGPAKSASTATTAPAKSTRAPAKAPATAKRSRSAEPAVEAEEAEDDGSGKRSFKLVSSEVEPSLPQTVLGSIEKGTYKGKTPMQAGKKCFSQICRRMMKEENNPTYACTFTIRESTRGSGGKHHTYRGERKELDTPQVINRSGTEYSIRFVNVVHAVKAEATA